MAAETSPVKAPSLLQEAFWPEMAMLVFFAASTAVEMAVNGGAMTMSQCLEFVTSGVRALKKARVSASVLYIFQLPAITRRRMPTSKGNENEEENDNAEIPRPGRGRRRTLRMHKERSRSFICW